jgi:hypothetical protein
MLPSMASDLAFLTHIHSPQRCVVPCENAQHRSRTEEARGSNPLTSTPPLMTSANAGHLHVRGRFGWPHNAWKSPHFATFEGMNQGPPDRLLRSLERYLRDATRADLEDFLADRLARRSAATAATRYKSCACCTAGWKRKRTSSTRWRRCAPDPARAARETWPPCGSARGPSTADQQPVSPIATGPRSRAAGSWRRQA